MASTRQGMKKPAEDFSGAGTGVGVTSKTGKAEGAAGGGLMAGGAGAVLGAATDFGTITGGCSGTAARSGTETGFGNSKTGSTTWAGRRETGATNSNFRLSTATTPAGPIKVAKSGSHSVVFTEANLPSPLREGPRFRQRLWQYMHW